MVKYAFFDNTKYIESLRTKRPKPLPPPKPLKRAPPPKRLPPKKYSGVCGRYIKRIDERDKTIKERERTIGNLTERVNILTEFKNSCINSNNRLITKNNALLDTTQYFNDQIFGNNSTPGYAQAAVSSQIQKDDILNQKLGQVATKEGFDTYNMVDNENNMIQNQINMNKQEHSVDNQLYVNLNNRIDSLNKANEILGWILFAVIIICAIVIWRSNESLTHKLVMIKVVWLYLIFVEILEYIFFYVYRYLNALLYGQPYDANDYWKFPTLTWMDIGIIILIALSVFI